MRNPHGTFAVAVLVVDGWQIVCNAIEWRHRRRSILEYAKCVRGVGHKFFDIIHLLGQYHAGDIFGRHLVIVNGTQCRIVEPHKHVIRQTLLKANAQCVKINGIYFD